MQSFIEAQLILPNTILFGMLKFCKMKLLSIIIPVYNVEQYVEQCINSCLNQDLNINDYEIIVVNDGSSDNSLSVVSKLASMNSNIVVFSQSNKGLSSARNQGLKLAVGKYVWFVDSDDWIETNCLRKIVDKMESDNLEGLVHSGFRCYDGNIELGGEVTYANSVMSGQELLSSHTINCAAVKTIYRKDFLVSNNLRFFEGIYHEDHEFTPRAYYFIRRIEFINDHLYYNRVTPGSITQKPNPKKAFDLIIVANNLYEFKRSHDVSRVETSFNDLISAALNQSLSNSVYMTEKEKKKLSCLLRKNNHLFDSLLHSSIFKYKIEGFMFKCLPSCCVKLYLKMK